MSLNTGFVATSTSPVAIKHVDTAINQFFKTYLDKEYSLIVDESDLLLIIDNKQYNFFLVIDDKNNIHFSTKKVNNPIIEEIIPFIGNYLKDNFSYTVSYFTV